MRVLTCVRSVMPDSLQEYCGSPFWNESQTWNTTDPDFSDCFQKTILVWLPCGFLWLLAPIEIYRVINSKKDRIPWNWLSAFRLAILIILLLAVISDFFFTIHRVVEDSYVSPHQAEIYTPIFLGITLILAGVLMIADKYRGIYTSGILFCFWLILFICFIIPFRTVVKSNNNQYVFTVCTTIIFFIGTGFQLILFGFADISSSVKRLHKLHKSHPEETASFLSLLTFSWFDRLVWTGFRRPLVTEDLWRMKESNQTINVCQRFSYEWYKHQNSERIAVLLQFRDPDSNQRRNERRHGLNSVSFLRRIESHSRKCNETKGWTISKRRPTLVCNTAIPLHNTSDANSDPLPDKSVSLAGTLRSAFGPTLALVILGKIVGHLFGFAPPLILRRLIQFVNSNEPQWHGFLYSALLSTCALFSSLFLNHSTALVMRMSLRLRSALISAIYKKALSISTSAKQTTAVGEIVNLMSVDTERLAEVIIEVPVIFTAPLQILLAFYFLWRLLGVAIFAGVLVIVLIIPFNGLIGMYLEKYTASLMVCKDERVKMMNEILNGIKVLKLYAWENSFQSLIAGIRVKELAVIKKSILCVAGITFLYILCPSLIALFMFATYILMDSSNVLDAATAFTAICLIGILKEPMASGPAYLGFVVQMRVCLQRISKFLNAKDIDEDQVMHIDKNDNIVIDVNKADFCWGLDGSPTLTSITFSVRRGSIVAIVGPVGSGKSSLIAALLGEMEVNAGSVNTLGSVAYVPQQAWIKNATVRDNILFTSPFCDEKYNKVLETCALIPDLAILTARDHTEIGEKGINLSGGQKQRVSLARAAYSNADLYLLDDPLSALDSHVGRHIFDQLIGPNGMLKSKTRVLVTHGLAFLPQVDVVIVLKEGRIAEMGTYKELIEHGEAFSEFVKSYQHQENESKSSDDSLEFDETVKKIAGDAFLKWKRASLMKQISASLSYSSVLSKNESAAHGKFPRLSIPRASISLHDNPVPSIFVTESSADGGKLIETETMKTEKVSWAVYRYYFQSAGFWRLALFLFFYAMSTAMGTGSNYWITIWSNDPPGDTEKRGMRLGVYTLLGVGEGIFTLVGYITAGIILLRAARILHDEMLLNILKSPMSFFDTTPMGRILNRFSRDVDTVDGELLFNVTYFANVLFELIGIFIIITIATPMVALVMLSLGIIYFTIQKFYISTSRQLKRLESTTRSPIYSHFSETLSGISTIRAFRLQHTFIKDSFEKVDANQSAMYPNFTAQCWLTLRLDFIGNMIILATSMFAVMKRDDIDDGILGLAVSYAITITFFLSWTAKIMCDLETQIVSVERIKEYTETPTEASWEIPTHKPEITWPSGGVVTFDKYSTRYREGLDFVLNGIECSIEGGERIGIVGRTGAGKSSLTLALFRLIEAAQGKIIVDGIDIGTLGLHDLRSRLTIIPQDPVLFSGSLRLNLDPFGAYSDSAVWNALEHAHLKDFVTSLSDGLQHQINEGGENLSVGQRQLVCLARALLRKTKILILDEATAAVDLQTDDLIQTTIRKEFSDCTILTIAHRLNTIMDSTRIMVLQNGVIREFDTPAALLENTKSEFYSMAKDAGLV